MAAVALEQLTKHYGGRIGVQDVNLAVGEGQLLGFLGPNGAGKTTAIRVLMGLLRASSGRARILGRDCWHETARVKQEVGYLPGDLRLYSWMTARRALQISSRVRRRDLTAAGRDLADRFALDIDLRVGRMSRGTRQKLGIILALAHEPRLLILDEPTTSLDPLMQEVLCTRLRELAERGHTVFFSSHTLSEVEQLCDRVAILKAGRLVADESLDALRSRAPRAVTLSFADAETARTIQVPDGLISIERRGHQVSGAWTGPTPALLGWAAAQALVDISISKPDLESLFHQYYESPTASATT